LDGWNPLNSGINHLSAGAGFRNHPPYVLEFEYLWITRRNRNQRRFANAKKLKNSVLNIFDSWISVLNIIEYLMTSGISSNIFWFAEYWWIFNSICIYM
jgi:hypothetical protein